MITVFSLGEKSTAKPIFSCYFSRKQWRKAQWIFFRIFTAQSNRCTYRRQRMFKKLHQHKLKCGISRILIYFDRFLQCSTKNCSVKNLPFQRLSRETKIIDIDVFVPYRCICVNLGILSFTITLWKTYYMYQSLILQNRKHSTFNCTLTKLRKFNINYTNPYVSRAFTISNGLFFFERCSLITATECAYKLNKAC